MAIEPLSILESAVVEGAMGLEIAVILTVDVKGMVMVA